MLYHVSLRYCWSQLTQTWGETSLVISIPLKLLLLQIYLPQHKVLLQSSGFVIFCLWLGFQKKGCISNSIIFEKAGYI